MTTETSADLLAALEGAAAALVIAAEEDCSCVAQGAWPKGRGECPACVATRTVAEARATIDAHKNAHRNGADDACPCYAQGWQDGHEGERRPPGA